MLRITEKDESVQRLLQQSREKVIVSWPKEIGSRRVCEKRLYSGYNFKVASTRFAGGFIMECERKRESRRTPRFLLEQWKGWTYHLSFCRRMQEDQV